MKNDPVEVGPDEQPILPRREDDELLFVTEKEVQDFLASNPQPSPATKAALEALSPDLVGRIIRGEIGLTPRERASLGRLSKRIEEPVALEQAPEKSWVELAKWALQQFFDANLLPQLQHHCLGTRHLVEAQQSLSLPGESGGTCASQLVVRISRGRMLTVFFEYQPRGEGLSLSVALERSRRRALIERHEVCLDAKNLHAKIVIMGANVNEQWSLFISES